VVYVLKESITASTKKAKARLFEGDPFNPLIFYTEGVVEINVKDIGGSLEETVREDGNIELTENEFIRYQSRMIECVDDMTIEEAREIYEGLDTDHARSCRGYKVKTCIRCEKETTHGRFSVLCRLKRRGQDS